MIVWKVKVVGSGSCLFENFREALEDFRSHDTRRFIYPVFISRERFHSLPEHGGW